MFELLKETSLGRRGRLHTPHGNLYLSDGSKIRIVKSQYLHDHSPIDANSPSMMSRTHRKSFLCHLLRAHERLGETIACMQNLGVTLEAMRKLQKEMD